MPHGGRFSDGGILFGRAAVFHGYHGIVFLAEWGAVRCGSQLSAAHTAGIAIDGHHCGHAIFNQCGWLSAAGHAWRHIEQCDKSVHGCYLHQGIRHGNRGSGLGHSHRLCCRIGLPGLVLLAQKSKIQPYAGTVPDIAAGFQLPEYGISFRYNHGFDAVLPVSAAILHEQPGAAAIRCHGHGRFGCLPELPYADFHCHQWSLEFYGADSGDAAGRT